MKELAIAGVQTQLIWENPEANFKHFDRLIDTIESQIDIIVLPEMFTTGFSMNPGLFNKHLFDQTKEWMQEKSIKLQSVITGSTICFDDGKYFNRLIWMQPDGYYQYYDKKHLFSYGNEPEHYTAGHKRVVIDYLGWRICPLICYDLRFPIWSRNNIEYDLLIYVANWPQKRIYAWKQLLIARAIENVCYTIGINRVGPDGNNVMHDGQSMLLDFMGNPIWSGSAEPEIRTAVINKDEMDSFRKSFGVLKDQDTLPKETYY